MISFHLYLYGPDSGPLAASFEIVESRLKQLDTLYFDQITPFVSYNSPVTVVDTSGVKPVAIDANGVYHYADSIVVTESFNCWPTME